MGVAQCYNLHIWSFSNLLPSILVTARHWEGARNWQWAHTVPDEHHSLDSPCTTGRNSGGVWEQILPRLEQLQLVSPVTPAAWPLPLLLTMEHHWLLPCAGSHLVRKGMVRHPAPHGGIHPAMKSSLRSTWTAQGQPQPKIFMVKVMLEMASAVLVCSI